MRRSRGIIVPETLLRLFLLHVARGYSLRETAVRAREAGLATISDVGLLKRLRRTLQVEVASVRLIDEARQELQVRAIDGVPLECVASIGIPLDAVNLHAPSMTNDVQPPPPGRDDWFAKIWAAMNMPFRAGMSVPLIVDGRFGGAGVPPAGLCR